MLTAERLSALLRPYVVGLELPPNIYTQCAEYLGLLLRWNARTNLTAVRDPEQLATRQLGESLFAARWIAGGGTMLDFGSGAGFPGIPLQLARPGLNVTLAESQGKKASFLREAIRTLHLTCEVWPARVETMPQTRQFDVVTMRAVDASLAMSEVAASRVAATGTLIRYVAGDVNSPSLNGWIRTDQLAIPGSKGELMQYKRLSVNHAPSTLS